MGARTTAIAFAMVAALCGCGLAGSTKPELDALRNIWKEKIDTAIPVGTDVSKALAWFEQQGLTLQDPLEKTLVPEPNKDKIVWLGSVRAREWYCDRWLVNVTLKASPEGKVVAYDFGTAGVCL
jgi:hypothetical protein